MNLLRKYKDGKNTANDLFANKDNINKIIFADEIYVDPSALYGVYNILDLLVAKMFKKFKSSLKYDKGKNDAEQQQRLLKSFQTVYRLISIVKYSKKILDDEFDYEGSVDKLSSLSDSMRLKEELINLMNTYNDCMNNGDKNVVIPILIDDIDMSFSHAYAMSEQIRKFLIVPGIIIILSVRIDQLLYCIKESNIRQLEWLAKKNYYSEMRGEIANMSSNYLSKLLPLAHRVNLPKVQDLLDDIVWILCKSKEYGCKIQPDFKMKLYQWYIGLYDELYNFDENHGSPQACLSNVNPMKYYNSWKLRGDNPELYRYLYSDFQNRKSLIGKDITEWNKYAFNDNENVEVYIRNSKLYYELTHKYFFNKHVSQKGGFNISASGLYDKDFCQQRNCH